MKQARPNYIETKDTPISTPLPISDDKKVVEFDDELFIRKTFETNAREGMALLYKRYYQPLCTHAVKYVGSREAAEDLVSEIFFQLYANKTFFDITSSYRFYLFRAVRNKAYNYLRWDLSRKADLLEAAQKPMLDEYQPDHISQFEELYHDVY